MCCSFRYWVFSWMQQGGVEDESEYQASLGALCRWLRESDECTHTTMHHNAVVLEEFLVKTIIKHKERCVYFLRKEKRTFGFRVTSAVESMNSATKKGCVNHVRPSDGLALSLKKQDHQATARMRFHARETYRLLASRLLWSTSTTANIVTEYAEGLIQAQSQQAGRYLSVRQGPSVFKVRRLPGESAYCHDCTPMARCKVHAGKMPITHFERVRTVEIKKFGNLSVMLCSCCYFQSNGIPCRHIIHVLHAPVQARHVAIRWHRSYLSAYLDEGSDNLQSILNQARRMKTPGPVLETQDLAVVDLHYQFGYDTVPDMVSGKPLPDDFFAFTSRAINPVQPGGTTDDDGCEDEYVVSSTSVVHQLEGAFLSQDISLTQEGMDVAVNEDGDASSLYTDLIPYLKELSFMSKQDDEVHILVRNSMNDVLSNAKDLYWQRKATKRAREGHVISSHPPVLRGRVDQRIRAAYEYL